MSHLTAEDLDKYQNSDCGQYATAVSYGCEAKPTYVPSYTERAYVMAGKSLDISKAYGVRSYRGAREKDPSYRYQGEKVDTIASYHTRSGSRKLAANIMSVSPEQTVTSSSTLPDEQASGDHVENAESVSSDNTWNWPNIDYDPSDDDSPGRLHSSQTEYIFEEVNASVEKPAAHKLNAHCDFTHVERVKGCVKDFGLYTSVNGHKFVLPAEVRVNLSKHPISLPKDLDVEKRYDMRDNNFLSKCKLDAEKWKTHLNLLTEERIYSMTAMEVCMFAFRYGTIMPLSLIPNLLYEKPVIGEKEEKDKSKLYSDWYIFKGNMKCPVEDCMMKDFEFTNLGQMFGHFEICHNNRHDFSNKPRIFVCNFDNNASRGIEDKSVMCSQWFIVKSKLAEHIAKDHPHNVLNKRWAKRVFENEDIKLGRPHKEGVAQRKGHKEKPSEIPTSMLQSTPTCYLPPFWYREIHVNDFPRMHVRTNCKIVIGHGEFEGKFAEVPNPLDEKEKFDKLQEKYVRKKRVVEEEEETVKFDPSVANPPTPVPFESEVMDVESTNFAIGSNLGSLVVNKNPVTPNPRRLPHCDSPLISTDVDLSETFEKLGDIIASDMDISLADIENPTGMETTVDLETFVDGNNNNPQITDYLMDNTTKRQRSQNSSPGRPMKEPKYEDTHGYSLDLVTKVGEIIGRTQKNLAHLAKEGQDTLKNLHDEVTGQMKILKDLQSQYEVLKSEKESSDRRAEELQTLVGRQAMELESLKKESEKEKDIKLPNDAETVQLENGKIASLIKPTDKGTFVKKAVMKIPEGITYMIIEGEYTMVPCVSDGKFNTLKVTKKEDGLKDVFEFAESQMPK